MNNIYIVLIRPQYPVNIGQICRTLKNFEVPNLRIVNPMCNIYSELCLRFSHNARDILYNSNIYKDIGSAIKDINIIISTTSRKRRRSNQFIKINNLFDMIYDTAYNNKVAILFGNEETGMTNEEMKYSNYLLNIPSSPEYPSLNLAHTVTIVLYELFKNKKFSGKINAIPKSADHSDMIVFYRHLQNFCSEIGFFKEKDPSRMMNSIIKIFQNMKLSPRDLKIFQGIISQAEWYIKNRPKGD